MVSPVLKVRSPLSPLCILHCSTHHARSPKNMFHRRLESLALQEGGMVCYPELTGRTRVQRYPDWCRDILGWHGE